MLTTNPVPPRTGAVQETGRRSGADGSIVTGTPCGFRRFILDQLAGRADPVAGTFSWPRTRPRSGVNEKTGVGSLQDRQVIEGKDPRPWHIEYPLPTVSIPGSTTYSLSARNSPRSWIRSPGSERSC